MIDEETWREIVDGLEDVEDVDRYMAAGNRLESLATAGDLPRLRELLAHRDQCVRETAAWPLAWLGGLDSLLDLLQAMHRGAVEGHDNDGITAALWDVVDEDPLGAKQRLIATRANADPHMLELVDWLMEFTEEE